MGISSKAQLRNTARQFLFDRDLSLVFDTVLGLAEDRIGRDVRVLKYLEASYEFTTSSNNVAVPSDFAGVRRLYINDQYAPEPEYKAPNEFWPFSISYTQSSVPSIYTIENGYLYFAPIPDSYTGRLLYYRRLPRLVNDGDTNTLLDNHAGIYLYAVLLETKGLLGDDPRMLTWATMWDDAMDALESATQLRNYPPGMAASTDTPAV